MDWKEIVFQIAIVVALVNWIKALTNDKLGFYSLLVSMGVSFAVVFLATLPETIIWFEFVRNSIIVGLSASGFYTVAGKIGNK
uniref:Holin n=1 Tax=viral metagenome TaxID=1070528 RepID=A0A6M3XJB4_9ZZZZ